MYIPFPKSHQVPLDDTVTMTERDFQRDCFDARNNVEPCRRIAIRIASQRGMASTDPIVDEIANAIEDARELGRRRAPYEAA